MARLLQISSGGNGVSANTTRYTPAIGDVVTNWIATESQAQVTMRHSGSMDNLFVKISTNTVTATSTIKSRKNGSDGNLSVSIGASTTGDFEDTSNLDTFVAGDELCIATVAGATGTTILPSIISTILMNSGDLQKRMVACNTGGNGGSGAATFYLAFVGGDSTLTSTEANVQYKVGTAGTLRNLFVNISTNSRVNSTTFKTRKNAGDGSCTLSVGAGATGFFEDTTHSDSIAAGDLVNFAIVLGTGTQDLIWPVTAIDFVTTNLKYQICNPSSAGTLAASATRYRNFGGMNSYSTTEGPRQTKAREKMTVTNLYAYVSANTITNATTLNFRKNAGNGNNVLSITGLTTGAFEDTTHSDSVATTDLICLRAVGGSGGTNIVIRTNGITATSLHQNIDTTKNLTYEIVSASQVDITKSLQYTVELEHEVTKGLVYAVRTTDHDITKALAYSVRREIDVTKALAYSVKAEVAVTKGLTYTVRTTDHDVTKGLAYAVRTEHDTTKGLTYSVITVDHDVTKGLVYAIKKAIAITKGLVYAILTNDHDITKGLSYAVKAEVAVTKGLTYTVIASAEVTKGLVYAVKQPEDVTKGLEYALLLISEIDITKGLKYTVLASVEATKGLKYAIRTKVAIIKGIIYKIKKKISSTKGLLYMVKTSFYKASYDDQNYTYDDVNLTYSGFDDDIKKGLAYKVKAKKSITKGLTYSIKTTHAITKGLAYLVRREIAIGKGLTYSVRIENEITKGLTYRVQTATGIQKGLAYSVRAEIGITKSLKYVVRVKQAIEKGLGYVVFGRIQITKGLSYYVRKTYSITKGLSYSVHTEVAITKGMEYAVLVEQGITKPLAYAIRSEIGITKGLQYEVQINPYCPMNTPYIGKESPYSGKSSPFSPKQSPYTGKEGIYTPLPGRHCN